MSPRTKMFMLTVLIMLVLFLTWYLLPFQVNLGYYFRFLGLIAVVVTIALWALITRIKRE
ncbi:MAG: hypothetical protein JSV64_07860 [Candidatus Bathyarchaeota archaeon]|nr:MAG: hypothetical protein JSV64_07860 [Candidatus Bathyarchaeota archaeon]